jgi:hypothetical protein
MLLAQFFKEPESRSQVVSRFLIKLKHIYQSTKQIRPCKIMHCIFFVAYCSRDDFRIEVIVQLLFQTTFYGEWFVQELHAEEV